MSKKVLILSGSPRIGGNSDTLCEQFKKGAEEVGCEVEKIFISHKKISYCHGCYYCQKNNGVCSIKDDMNEILDKMQQADVIVLASPLYFYSLSAQLKAVIDRCVARWTSLKNKEFYYIMTSAENSETTMNCAIECFRGFAVCLDGSVEKGMICAKGVYDREDIKNTPYMNEAYELGKTV